jgi:sirohydrochlorin cobaltochelatase
LADVILAQVRQFQAVHLETRNLGGASVEGPGIGQELARFMERAPSPWKIGEVAIRPVEGGSFHVLHQDDLESDPAGLRCLPSPEDLRELIRLDREGNFRPLRAGPNLRRGWLLHAPDRPGLQLAFDYLYPAGLANWTLWRQDALPTTPWSETAERQTGRFRVVREIDDAAIQELAAQVCRPGCLKRRLWHPATQPVEAGPREIPLVCPEACNFLVGKAREKLKGPDRE